MEQALSDSQILSHIQLLSSEHMYTLKQIHSVDYERKLLGGDRHKAREREADRDRELAVFGWLHVVTVHLRPTFYTLQFSPVPVAFRMLARMLHGRFVLGPQT